MNEIATHIGYISFGVIGLIVLFLLQMSYLFGNISNMNTTYQKQIGPRYAIISVFSILLLTIICLRSILAIG